MADPVTLGDLDPDMAMYLQKLREARAATPGHTTALPSRQPAPWVPTDQQLMAEMIQPTTYALPPGLGSFAPVQASAAIPQTVVVPAQPPPTQAIVNPAPTQAVVTGVPAPTQAVVTGVPAPPPTPGTPEYRQQQVAGQTRTAGLVSGGAQAAQLAAAMISTRQDKENRERLKAAQQRQDEIAKEMRKGDFGLSGEQRDMMERGMLAPVQALARQSQMQEEAALASMGDTSVASQVRARRESRRQVADQARLAGASIEQSNIAEAQRQIQELKDEAASLRGEEESRIAYIGERQRRLLNEVGQTVSGAAGVAGTMMGAQAISDLNLEGLDPLQQELAINLARGGDQDSLVMLQLMNAYADQG